MRWEDVERVCSVWRWARVRHVQHAPSTCAGYRGVDGGVGRLLRIAGRLVGRNASGRLDGKGWPTRRGVC